VYTHNIQVGEMTCPQCGRSLVQYYDETKCLNCDGLAHLDPITAIAVWEQRFEHFNNLYNNELKKWDIDYMLANILALREKSARNYIKEYGPMELGRYATYSILLDRVMRFSVYGGKIPAEQAEVTRLTNGFEVLFRIEDQLIKLKSCYGDVLYLKPFNLEKMTIQENIDNFIFVENDRYDFIRKTFAIYDIYSEQDAKRIIEQYKAEEENIDHGPMEYRHFEPPEFIVTNFQILNAMYSLFLRDKTFAELFGRLRDYRRLMTNPNRLMEFVWKFNLINEETQTYCPTNNFIKRAAEFFNESEEKVRDVLLYEKYNKSIFPLFVRFNVKSLGDGVFNSHRFSFLIHTFLHAILTEDLFNNETVKRSLEFERKKVKEAFEKESFEYIPNVTDKKNSNLEIDGLAVKGDRCYVVECKGWRLGKFIDEKGNRDNTVRDLKGIVLGEKYSMKNGKLVTERKPSIKEKIDYIVKNQKQCIPNKEEPLKIEGLIVTIGYPPIKEFNEIRMISIKEIPNIV
jgi:hypothetical protein